MTGFTLEDILWKVITVVVIMLSIVLHEIGHGYAAYLMGDTTAKQSGRLSLNPLKHIDPFGSVILPLILAFAGGFVIGYAKPVPYNPARFKNIRKGEVLVGLAGPAVNLVLALAGSVLALLVYNFAPGTDVWNNIWQLLATLVLVNTCLMFFNLIPLPPLDGSSIIAVFLSDRALQKYYSIQRYSMPILLALLILVPWVSGLDPIGWYLEHTAYALGYWLLGI